MTRAPWRWIAEDVVLAIHDSQLAEHSGLAGVRDRALLQSALARPRNLPAYGAADVEDLGAAYCYGIAQNHAFIDGNKRTAFVVAYVLLLDHGFELSADDPDTVRVMLSVAAGEETEAGLAQWFRQYMRPLPPA